jgi:hypothetical protein
MRWIFDFFYINPFGTGVLQDYCSLFYFGFEFPALFIIENQLIPRVIETGNGLLNIFLENSVSLIHELPTLHIVNTESR